MKVLRKTALFVLVGFLLTVALNCNAESENKRIPEHEHYYYKGVEYGVQGKFDSARVEFEKAADGSGLCTGAFKDHLFHFGDWGDFVCVGDAQGRRQVGVRIGIDGQHFFAHITQGADQ